LKCFGNNAYGQIWYGDVEDRGNQVNELGDYLPYIDLGTGKLANSVLCGAYHTVFSSIISFNFFKFLIIL